MSMYDKVVLIMFLTTAVGTLFSIMVDLATGCTKTGERFVYGFGLTFCLSIILSLIQFCIAILNS